MSGPHTGKKRYVDGDSAELDVPWPARVALDAVAPAQVYLEEAQITATCGPAEQCVRGCAGRRCRHSVPKAHGGRCPRGPTDLDKNFVSTRTRKDCPPNILALL